MKYASLFILVAAVIFGFLYWRDHGFDFTPRTDMEQSSLQDLTTLPNQAQRLVDMHEMQHGASIMTDEKVFLENMIPHHEEAIDTAGVVLARGGTTAGVKALAKAIIATQRAEVVDMKAWYQAWYGEAYVALGTYTPMMPDLTRLSGVALDKAFLEGMIAHHEGAIAMAKGIQPYIKHNEIKIMVNTIIQVQTQEISEMKTLLVELR